MTKEAPSISVKKNTIFNILKTCSTILFPLITFPYISRVLGAENIGKINFGNSIISYFSLLSTLGINAYAIRECSKVKNDINKLSKISSQIISINVVTTVISYTILFICLLGINKLFPYRILILAQSFTIIFTMLGADWMNTAMEDFKFIALRTFGVQLFALATMFLFVKKPEHYLIYAIIGVISLSGANIVNLIYRKRYCTTRFTLYMEWKRHFPPIISMFVMSLSQSILSNLDITMLGFLTGDYAVGLYSTAIKVINITTQVVTSITWVLMPQLSYNFGEKNYTKITSILEYGISFTFVLGMPCIVGIMIMSKEIIMVIGGSEYLAASNCLRVLAMSMLFHYLYNIYGNLILLPAGYEKRFMKICSISALINLIGNALLIPVVGIIGAAITTCISSFSIFLLSRKVKPANIELPDFKHIICSPIIGSCTVAFICLIAKCLIQNILIRLIVAILFSCVLYLSCLLILKNKLVVSYCDSIVTKFFKGRKL